MITGCGSSSDSSNEPGQLAALPDLHNEGVVGEKGDTGPTGPAGPQGIQGVAGSAGQEGVDGVDGVDGIDGIDGIQGEAGADGAYVATQPVIDHLKNLTGIDTFLEIVDRLGLVNYLSDGDQRLTLFVPTDEAFNALSRDQLEDLLEDDARMESLVYTHLLHEERVTASSVLHPRGDFSSNHWGYLSDVTFEIDPGNPDQLLIDMSNYRVPGITPENSLFTQAAAVYLVDDFIVDDYFFAPDTGSLLSKMGRLPQYSVFTNALRLSGLADEMKDSDQVFSVYAVNNDYFSTIGGIDVEVEKYGSLRAFLENHITERTFNDTSVEPTQYLESLSGLQLRVTQTDDVLRVNGIRVIDDEKVQASNGTIYGLDYAIQEIDNAGQPVNALSVVDVLNLASERYAAEVANGAYGTSSNYNSYYGYGSYYNNSFSSDYNPYEFFKELIVAAQMESLFESPANEWTLLVPINGFIPDDINRKYSEYFNYDYYEGYYYGNNSGFESIFDPSEGGTARDLGTYLKSMEPENISYSLVPDLIPDALAAQRILFAHMIRGTYRSDEFKALSGSNISTIDGADNMIATVGNLPSIKGTSFVGMPQVAVNGYIHVIQDFLVLPQAFIDSFPDSLYQLHGSSVVRAIAEHGDYDKYLNGMFGDYGTQYLDDSRYLIFVTRDSDIEGDMMSYNNWQNSIFSTSNNLIDGAVLRSIRGYQYSVGRLGDVPTINGLPATLIYDGASGARVYSIPGVLD